MSNTLKDRVIIILLCAVCVLGTYVYLIHNGWSKVGDKPVPVTVDPPKVLPRPIGSPAGSPAFGSP